jgi:hypothetical protein
VGLAETYSSRLSQTENLREACPFGVCMGDNPELFFATEVIAKNWMSLNTFVVDIPIVPLSAKSLQDFVESDDESVLYKVYYSKQTGVCAVQLDALLNDSKKTDFIDELKRVVKGYTLSSPRQTVRKNSTVLIWEERAEGHASGANFIGLAFPHKGTVLGMEQALMVRIILEFRFPNYGECVQYEPEIPR